MIKKLLLFTVSILLLSCSKDEIQTEYSYSAPDPMVDVIESYNKIPLNGRHWERIQDAVADVHNNLVYSIDGERYLLFPGFGFIGNEKGYPILFKEVDDQWVYLKSFLNIGIEQIRNHRRINETTFLLAGAAENNAMFCDCNGLVGRPSDMWIVKAIKDDVIFTKVNSEEDMNYFHDASFGDIDGDGLYDVVSTTSDVWFQNQDGSFRKEKDVMPPTYGTVYFSVEVGDIIGDSRNEVVKATYMNPEYEYQNNGYVIYQFNDDSRKMEEVYHTTSNPLVPNLVLGANKVRILDINNDGQNDLLINREGAQGSVEIWLGNGTVNLTPVQMIGGSWDFEYANWGTEYMDVNNDGFLDIVFRGHWEKNKGIAMGDNKRAGIKFNGLIWINDGSGKFNMYSKRDLIGGVGTRWNHFYPYMRDGHLTFLGDFTEVYRGEDYVQITLADGILKYL